jgi:hypothetical protein
METKVQKLKHWLCRTLCEQPGAVTTQSQGFESFNYEGYDVEVRYVEGAVVTRVTLKGTCVLSGRSMADGEWVWIYDAPHVPSYKVRMFVRDYSENYLQQLRNK